MMAMGIWGKGTYLADSWNRLDMFIVLAGAVEYCQDIENINLSPIRTIRVLRPLRAINRIPSEYNRHTSRPGVQVSMRSFYSALIKTSKILACRVIAL